jgi:NitT/TauT family transport system permease protein
MTRRRLMAERTTLLLGVVVLWEALPRLGFVDPFFTSSPSLVAGQLWLWISSGVLAAHIAITASEALIGFSIGVLTGAAVGIACGLYEPISRALFPLIAVGNSLPKLAFAPLLIGWFGFGPSSKVALAAAVVFFFIFFAVYSGIRTIDQTIVANARILGGSGWSMLRQIYIPSAFSWIVAGVRLGLAYAFAAAVIGEYLGGNQGLGFLIVYGKEMLSMTDMFAGLAVVVTIVGLLDTGLRRLDAYNARWRMGHGEQEIRA